MTIQPGLKLLRSQRGITLVELMIVVFTGGLLLVMAMGTLLNISGTSNNFSLNLDTEIQELQALNALQLVFSQATELKFANATDLNTYSSTNGRGAMVGEFDSDTVFGSSLPVTTLAVFMRDRTNSRLTGISALSSTLTPTAVHFQQPTPLRWGALYIALGDSSSLAPGKNQLFFDGLVRFRILNVSTYNIDGGPPSNGEPVTSFDVELTFRRFLGDVKPEARMFCPVTNMAACPGIGAYKDVARVHKLILRNNILDRSPNSPGATTRGGRMYDLIHFFNLGKPANL